MWVFGSWGKAAWRGARGGGYPWAPLSITPHPCTPLCIPPCNPPKTSGGLLRQNGERKAPRWLSLPCASDNCLSAQTGLCPSLERKAAAGSRAGWCRPRHVFLWMGERHVEAQPDLLVAGAHSIHVGQETSSAGRKTCQRCVCAEAVVRPHAPAVLHAVLVGKHQPWHHREQPTLAVFCSLSAQKS